jgi:hypothetical protein
MSTVYNVNNQIYAVNDVIFGWCLSFDPINWTPISNSSDLEVSHLQLAKDSFVSPVYPQELKDAINAAIERCSAVVDRAKEDQDIRIEMAEAKAVSGVEEELKKLKWANRQALSRLAILHLRTLEQTTQVKRTIAIPKEPDLVLLLDGLIPFTD